MRPQNIEHPDITKLSDLELYHESEYLIKHVQDLLTRISRRVSFVSNGYKYSIPSIPISKMADDLKIALSRHNAIVEEIEYRAEMMR